MAADALPNAPPWRPRLADGLAFGLPFLLACVAGWQARQHGLADLGALAAAQKAWDIFHLQAHANLALIGFDQPPLLPLLHLPAAAFAPGLLVSGLAGPLLGAAFLGLSTLVLCRLGRALDLPGWVIGVVAASFCLHPLVLSYAALGARAMVLIFTLLGLSASLVLWARTDRLRDLVTGGLFAAAAVLLAYETLALVVAAAAFIAWRCRRGPATAPARAEGTLIAFLLPTAYVAAVWVIADWVIMGELLHFWRAPLVRALAVGREASRDWLQPLLTVVIIANPLLLGLVYGHLRRTQSPPTGTPAAGMLVAAILSPLVFITLRPVGEDGGPWMALMPVAAAAVGVGAVLLVAFLSDLWRAGADWRRVMSPGLAVIAVGSLVLAYDMQFSHRGLPVGLRSPLRGYPAFAARVSEEWAVGDRLRGQLPTGSRNVIAGSLAFVVAFRAEAGQGTAVSDAPDPPGVGPSLGLTPGSLLLLRDPDHVYGPEWQVAVPRLHLAPLWTLGAWTCHECREGPPAAGGQSPSAGAIIRAGAPPRHAHTRR
jgi:hypothetical protein